MAAPTERVLSLPGWEVRINGPEEMLEPLAAAAGSIGAGEELPPLELAISPDGRQATGTVEGRVLWSVEVPRSGWLSLLLGHIGATAASLLRRLLFVHAGAVAIEERGWVLVGESGAGKTSTVAVLVRGGAGYLTDEIAMLDPAEEMVTPFALPMTVKPWTAKAAATLPAGTTVAREGATRFYLPAHRMARPVPLEAFVLLTSGERTGLQPLSRAALLLALSEHPTSLRYRNRLEDAFAGFGRLLRTARCYSLAAPAAQAARLIAAAARSEKPFAH